MNRREALEKVSLMLGGAIIGGQAFLSSSFRFRTTNGLLSDQQISLLNEIGETILPTTDTPGAREADVGRFMDAIVSDCYTREEQKIFLEGLTKLEAEAQQQYGKKFLDLNSRERTSFLTGLDQAHTRYMASKTSGQPVHYFRMLKELTLTGYFTSEPGATKFLKYTPAPGRYDGCTSEKPWH